MMLHALINAAACVMCWLTLAMAALWLLRRQVAAARRLVCRLALAAGPLVLAAALIWSLAHPRAGLWTVNVARPASQPASALALAAAPRPAPARVAQPPSAVPIAAAPPLEPTAAVQPRSDEIGVAQPPSAVPVATDLHSKGAPVAQPPAVPVVAGIILLLMPLVSISLLALLARDLARLGRWRRTWQPATPAWQALAQRMARRIGLERPFGTAVAEGLWAPAAAGIWRPTLVLPATAARPAGTALRGILAHELGHLAGRDPLWQFAARLVTALLWWCPPVWWLSRRQRIESEFTADDVALSSGTAGPSLAKSLLAFAQVEAPCAAEACLSRMAWHLKRRITVMINDTRPHDPRPSRPLCWLLPLAALVAAAAIAATPLISTAQAPASPPASTKPAPPPPPPPPGPGMMARPGMGGEGGPAGQMMGGEHGGGFAPPAGGGEGGMMMRPGGMDPIAMAQNNLQRAEQNLQQVRAQREQGQAEDADVIIAESQVRQARQELENQKAAGELQQQVAVIQQRMQGYQNALGLAMQALENVIRQQFSPDQIAKVRARVDRLKERLAAAKKELDAKCAELQEKVPPFGGVFLRGAPLGPVPPQQALEQAQAHLEEVRRQKEQGKATQQDLILAEAQVLKAKNDIAQEQSAGEIENLKREVGMSRVQVQSLRQAVQQLHDENASPDKVAPFEAQLKETESKLATQQKQMNDLEDKWLQWREVALRPDSRPMPPAPQALPPELLALEMQLIDLQGQKQLVVSKLQDSERKARAGQITQAEKREVEVQNDVLDKKIDLLKQEIQKQRLAAGIPESQPAGAMMEPSMPGGEGMPGQPHKTGAAK